MKPLDFDYLQKLLKERSGLVLSSEKVYLVESRLMPVARNHGMSGLDELIDALRLQNNDLMVEVTDAMTTNESFFFRDIKPFESFRDTILPAIAAARTGTATTTIRIWSAACSSGQEAYSLAMNLTEDQEKYPGLRFEIVGTDLSGEMVQKAKQGVYTQFEVQRGLPVTLLIKYFKQVEDRWQIDDKIRKMVAFSEFNLLQNFNGLGTFDVVFCRNVLIYFDPATKSEILGRVAGLMPTDGVLYLGGAESVLGISDEFKPYPNLRGAYVLKAATDAGTAGVTATAG